MADHPSKRRKTIDSDGGGRRPEQMALDARHAGRILQAMGSEQRNSLLHNIANAMDREKATILARNKLDIEKARQDRSMEKTLQDRLVLSESKLATLIDGIRKIARAPDAIGQVLDKTLLAEGLILEKVSVPIGVLLIIFESRPDALPQIIALSIKSGNGLILKGGKEARHSNECLHKIITQAVLEQAPELSGLVGLVQSREDIKELLVLDKVIDLCIPRGGNKLVSFIKANTKIPVLGHADGVCHVYVHGKCDIDKATRKLDYPAACNAMETLLLDQSLFGVSASSTNGGASAAVIVLESLVENGVTLLPSEQIITILENSKQSSKLTQILTETREKKGLACFRTEYSALECNVHVVDSLEEAVDHIHRYGSGHTECIVTEEEKSAQTFLKTVDSACVFHNASTRMADGFRFGLGAEVGISTGRIHARGPVGVEGLTTTKYKLVSSSGNGDTAADFSKSKKRFLHHSLKL